MASISWFIFMDPISAANAEEERPAALGEAEPVPDPLRAVGPGRSADLIAWPGKRYAARLAPSGFAAWEEIAC
jgi:hypothetical protein